jgi:hypothetical protein
MQKALMIAALLGLGVAPLVATTTAEAKQTRKSLGTVTACSTNGRFDCYTARVVQSPVGRKLVLRGGATIDCGYDCRDTLREKTVDFWDERMLNGS